MMDYRDLVDTLIEYEKLEIDVKQLTGFDFKCLRDLFAKGYTLTPPKPPMPLSEMAELLEQEMESK